MFWPGLCNGADMKIKNFSMSDYVDHALALAVYEADIDGGFIACVPDKDGFFSQGDTY